MQKEVTEIDKNGKEITKNVSYILHITYLLIAQDLWQAHYEILSIIFLMGFIKLNVNVPTIIKNGKLAELNINIVTVFFNRQTLKTI